MNVKTSLMYFFLYILKMFFWSIYTPINNRIVNKCKYIKYNYDMNSYDSFVYTNIKETDINVIVISKSLDNRNKIVHCSIIKKTNDFSDFEIVYDITKNIKEFSYYFTEPIDFHLILSYIDIPFTDDNLLYIVFNDETFSHISLNIKDCLLKKSTDIFIC